MNKVFKVKDKYFARKLQAKEYRDELCPANPEKPDAERKVKVEIGPDHWRYKCPKT